MRTLADLKIGEIGIITSLEVSPLQGKMLGMNLVPGNTCKLLFKAPFGDPLAIFVSGYILSLRKSEASLVFIN